MIPSIIKTAAFNAAVFLWGNQHKYFIAASLRRTLVLHNTIQQMLIF